jgi:NAD+ kinase
MPQVAIIYKAHTPEAGELAGSLAQWLDQRGAKSQLRESGPAQPANGREPEPVLDRGTSLVVVLGGDGTMLGAVRAMVSSQLCDIPILGVNLGGLGFLTAISPSELLPAMEKVLAGEFKAPPRMMLNVVVERAGILHRRLVALNDVVINKAALARIVELETAVDGEHLTTFRSDGLIVSTPTGSTAYNLSAGGPICHPALDCLVVTPICSFALSNRPLLLGPQMTLAISLGAKAEETTLTCDGQVGIELREGDKVVVSRADQGVRLIQSPFKDYFEILRAKLRWG